MEKNSWSEEEDGILKSYYPDEGEAVVKRLSGRTVSAVKMRAWKIGAKSRNTRSYERWTDEEKDIIREYYPSEGNAVLKRLPGKTKRQLIGHTFNKGIYYSDHEKKFDVVEWSDDEDGILRKYYPSEGSKIIARLPGRTPNAIKTRASFLGLKYRNSGRNSWTDEDIRILKEYFQTEGSHGVYERLNGRFTNSAISVKASRLGLKKALS